MANFLSSTLAKVSQLDFRVSVFVGLVFRLLLMLYSYWQDTHSQVKYTDVDYFVFQDAAQAVHEDRSPYTRATYRYTPLLAYLMYTVEWVCGLYPWGGKLVFVSADVVVALYLFYLHAPTRWIVLGWLWNPFVATISTRGNAEALVCVCCLALIYHLERACSNPPKTATSSHSSSSVASSFLFSKNVHFMLSALWFGFAVHLKIYPVIYVVPLFKYLLTLGSFPRTLAYFFISFTLFAGCFLYFYVQEGLAFVMHTYGYHLVRLDHRHNFSIYAYALTFQHPFSLWWLPFVAQSVGVVILGWVFPPSQLVHAMFAQTVYFVAVNKVMTSQYFMWFLCYLPYVLPHFIQKLANAPYKGWGLLLSWLGSQAVWLHFAYQLEFQAQNTYLFLFLSSIGLYISHLAILYVFVQPSSCVTSSFPSSEKVKKKSH